MIAKIELENFQGFCNRTEAEFAPLTLIFGPNASGKSSIIRSLLMLKQSFAMENELGHLTRKFTFQGESISLASYENIVHKHESDRDIVIRIDLKAQKHLLGPNARILALFEEISLEFRFGIGGISQEIISFSTVGSQNALKLTFDITENICILSEITGTELIPDLLSKIIEQFPSRLASDLSKEDLLSFNWEEALKTNQLRMRQLIPSYSIPAFITRKDKNGGNRTEVRVSDDFESSRIFVLEFNRLLEMSRSLLLNRLENIDHIGPLRKIEERINYNPEILLQSRAGSHSRGGRLNKKADRDAVSNWLLQLTNGRYKFETIDFLPQEIKFLGKLTSRVVIDTATNTPVSFSDVGVGLSQVLPILEKLQQSGDFPSVYGAGKTLLIEQPELHLHPRMQSDLADLLIATINENPSFGIIAETHSESMLLRIQKRLREGVLDPQNIRILFVDRVEDENKIIPLEIREDEDFTIKLPVSFSELRLQDLI